MLVLNNNSIIYYLKGHIKKKIIGVAICKKLKTTDLGDFRA